MHFAESLKPLTIFLISFILDVPMGSEYVSEMGLLLSKVGDKRVNTLQDIKSFTYFFSGTSTKNFREYGCFRFYNFYIHVFLKTITCSSFVVSLHLAHYFTIFNTH